MSLLVPALLLALASAAQASTPFSSLLITTGNVSSVSTGSGMEPLAGPVDYATCQTDPTMPDLRTLVPQEQLANYQANAVWFGGSPQQKASDFEVQSCTVLALDGGRTVDVFATSGEQPTDSDCSVTWFSSDTYLTVLVNLTGADSFWLVSLPLVPSAVTRSACYGTRAECQLASTVPCNNVNALGSELPSFLASSPSGAQCTPGEVAPGENGLLYGLQATFYPSAYPDCGNSDPNAVYIAPNLTELSPDSSLSRCQANLDYLVPDSLFPSDPPLPARAYSSCYAVDLKGFVDVQNNTDLAFLTPEPVPKFYRSYRVCLRFSNIVKFWLNNDLLISSSTGDYDTVLTCLDIPSLPQGLVPFELEYSVPPNGVDSVILQFYIIPVSQVASDFRPGEDYQVTYKCDCCSLFAPGGDCCQPVSLCGFSSTCGTAAPPLPLPTPSPPSLPVLPPPPPTTEPIPSPPPSQHLAPAPGPIAGIPPYVPRPAPESAPHAHGAPPLAPVPQPDGLSPSQLPADSTAPPPSSVPLPAPGTVLPPALSPTLPPASDPAVPSAYPKGLYSPSQPAAAPAGSSIAPAPIASAPIAPSPAACPPPQPCAAPLPEASQRRGLGEVVDSHLVAGAHASTQEASFAVYKELVGGASSWEDLEAILRAR